MRVAVTCRATNEEPSADPWMRAATGIVDPEGPAMDLIAAVKDR